MRRPAPGSGFAHRNGEQRVCGESSANRAGAAAGKRKSRLWVCASKRRTKGLRGVKRKPRRRCSGKKEKSRLWVCASKRRIKGLRGVKRKPRRRCSGKKGKFRLRVCASKRRTKGLQGAERKPRRCCSGGKGNSRLWVCASKRRIKGLRGAERKPWRREKSRRLSLVNGGRRRRHIRIIQFYGAPETCGRGECVFLWGVKR